MSDDAEPESKTDPCSSEDHGSKRRYRCHRSCRDDRAINNHSQYPEALLDRVTLFCFHPAGGAARQYAAWAPHLPTWIRLVPMDLPGHGTRRAELPLVAWKTIVADCLARLRGPAPWALFGHSMGALTASEIAHALTQAGTAPLWIGLAGCGPRTSQAAEPDWLSCPREMVVQRLRELGGTPEEVLANSELLGLLLPTIRLDFALCATHAPPPRPRLTAPILALGGDRDRCTARELGAWADETSGRFRLEMLPGDHFFPFHDPARTVALVSAELSRTLREVIA